MNEVFAVAMRTTDDGERCCTCAELFFVLGTIVEGSASKFPSGVYSTAHASFADWLRVAEYRGFGKRKRLREALRVGRITPRGRRLCSEVVSYIAPTEMTILLERLRRFDALMTKPTPENIRAAREGPIFTVHRARPVEIETGVCAGELTETSRCRDDLAAQEATS